MSKSRVFIGSSSEALPVAQMLQSILHHEFEPIVWTDGIVEPNETIFTALLRERELVDFAIFILTGDDVTESRGRSFRTPRDNVLFEFGLFMGTLGPERTFALRSDGADLKILSDLAGISFPIIRASQPSGAGVETAQVLRQVTQAALTTACFEIREIMKRRGPRRRLEKPRTTSPMTFGSISQLNVLADAAIFLEERRSDFKDELYRRIAAGHLVPGKLLYFSDEATVLWKEICKLQAYRFYKDSREQLERVAEELVDIAIRASGHDEFDLISLGVGDGAKDEILLTALLRKVGGGCIHYYPIDISESMLVDGILGATATIRASQNDHLKVKGIIGDITKLKRFESVYERRPRHNLFSFLGNTLGNNDEAEIIEALHRAMFPKDLVLVEANVASPGQLPMDPFVRDDLNMRHDFSPLSSLGLQFESTAMSYRETSGISVIGGKTRSIIAICDGTKLHTDNPALKREIKLSVVHHYEKQALEETLALRLRSKLLWSVEHRGVALMLFQRP